MFVRLLVAVSLFLISATLLAVDAPPQKEILKKETSTKPTKEDAEKQKIENKVKALLKEELTINKTTEAVFSLKNKRLTVNTCYEGVCLILIRGETTFGDGWYDLYRLYSINTVKGIKTEIDVNQKHPIYSFSFVQAVYLGKTKVPDMLTFFDDCTECEPAQYISVLYFDEVKKEWRIRKIANGSDEGNGIFVGYAEHNTRFDCKYQIRDGTQDGYDDIITWCREIVFTDDSGTIGSSKEKFSIYYLASDVLKEKKISDPKEVAKIKESICKQMKEKKETNEYLKCN